MRILLGSISVLPTHVGVILNFLRILLERYRTTHTRGGDPRIVAKFSPGEKYYPHTWG